MKLVESYIAECVKYLPRLMREDVRLELQSELSEMIESASQNQTIEEATISVLESMGSPKHLADQYLNKQSYLIGPRYFDMYIKILKIVFFALTLAFTITFAMKIFFSATVEIWILFEYLGTIFNACIIAFAYITAIFFVIERFEVKVEDVKDNTRKWRVEDLPIDVEDIPNNVFEHVFEIGFTFVLLFIINLQPQLIGVYFQSEQGWVVTPILNELTKASWLGLINAWLMLLLLSGILKSIVRLSIKTRLKGALILEGLAIILFIYIAFTQSLINPNIAQSIAPNNDSFELLVSRGILATGIAIIIASLASWINRAFRYFKLKLDV